MLEPAVTALSDHRGRGARWAWAFFALARSIPPFSCARIGEVREATFKIEEPALALNDVRVGGPIRMSRTIKVRPDDMRENILGCVAAAAAATPDGRLKSLVLNSHGEPGYMIMGEGFWAPHSFLFQKWAGLVDNIWLTCCRIASRAPLAKGDRIPKGFKGAIGDGYLFCRDMAMQARCNVIASLNDQDCPHSTIPPGYVDAFEGTVLCFKPSGDIAWAKRYELHNSE